WPLPRVLPVSATRAPVLGGALAGAVVVGLGVGATARARSAAASRLSAEVRRQFIDTPGIRSGEVRADYARTGDVATKAALRGTMACALIALLVALTAGVGVRWAYGGEGNEGWW